MNASSIWAQGLMNSQDLNLPIVWNHQWSDYIRALNRSHVKIQDLEDELQWIHSPFGFYTPKEGYILSYMQKRLLSNLHGGGNLYGSWSAWRKPNYFNGAFLKTKFLWVKISKITALLVQAGVPFVRTLRNQWITYSFCALFLSKCGGRFWGVESEITMTRWVL